jgi:hypothetical protein
MDACNGIRVQFYFLIVAGNPYNIFDGEAGAGYD